MSDVLVPRLDFPPLETDISRSFSFFEAHLSEVKILGLEVYGP